jgi:hypothetical protein
MSSSVFKKVHTSAYLVPAVSLSVGVSQAGQMSGGDPTLLVCVFHDLVQQRFLGLGNLSASEQ